MSCKSLLFHLREKIENAPAQDTPEWRSRRYSEQHNSKAPSKKELNQT